MFRGRRWLMNLKRSRCRCCLFLMLQRWCSKIFLRKNWWWFGHHSLFLRTSLKSSQSNRERNYSGILLRILIITKKEIIRHQNNEKN
jgi:hypothetical protein